MSGKDNRVVQKKCFQMFTARFDDADAHCLIFSRGNCFQNQGTFVFMQWCLLKLVEVL